MTIHKYTLDPALTVQEVPLAVGDKVLCVQNQDNKIVVYVSKVEEYPATPKLVTFLCFLTGNNGRSQHWRASDYIGTVQLSGGEFVVHVFLGEAAK